MALLPPRVTSGTRRPQPQTTRRSKFGHLFCRVIVVQCCARHVCVSSSSMMMHQLLVNMLLFGLDSRCKIWLVMCCLSLCLTIGTVPVRCLVSVGYDTLYWRHQNATIKVTIGSQLLRMIVLSGGLVGCVAVHGADGGQAQLGRVASC